MLNLGGIRAFLFLLVGLSPSALFAADENQATRAGQKPTLQMLRAWVGNLASPKFDERESSLAALIAAGKPAIAPLAEAVMSGDPEVAWRAATALEAIGLEGDEVILNEIKTRMETTKGTPNRDLAQILNTLTQRWAAMQQTKSQNALVKMGATFPDANNGGLPVAYPGGTVFMGSYASAPAFSSSTVLIESFATPIPTIPPPSTAAYDPLEVPSSLAKIIEGMEKIEAEKSEDAKSEKIDSSNEEKDAATPASEKADSADKETKTERIPEKSKRVEDEAEDKSDKTEKKKSESEDPSTPADMSKETPEGESTPKTEPVVDVIETTGIDLDRIASLPAVEPSFSFLSVGSAVPLGTPTVAAHGTIRLDQNYHGGDGGLVHLAGLPHINLLEIHDAMITDKAIPYIAKMPSLTNIMIRGSKITPEALKKLKRARPTISIRGQGRGILGINADEAAADCVITRVSPGAPSEAAGIQVGDRILKLDGKEVTDFLSLTLLMMNREPGDEVKVTIKRGEETMVKIVKLASREAIIR